MQLTLQPETGITSEYGRYLEGVWAETEVKWLIKEKVNEKVNKNTKYNVLVEEKIASLFSFCYPL